MFTLVACQVSLQGAANFKECELHFISHYSQEPLPTTTNQSLVISATDTKKGVYCVSD